MSNPRDLHIEASKRYNEARKAFEQNQQSKFETLLRESYRLEKESASMLFDKLDAEPTRSVLFRGAASLAIQCGEFLEAEKLVFAALAGNPPADIQYQLTQLKEDYIDNALFQKEASEKNMHYIFSLRDSALNLRVKPASSIYTENGVVVNGIIDFLQTAKSSWENYLTVNFKKNFANKYRDNLSQLVSSLRKDSPLLSVNNKFASFGVSLVCDTRVVKSSGYEKDVRIWRQGIFEDFKNELFLSDLNDPDHVNAMSAKYDDVERNIIFKKLVDTLKQKKYTISLVDNSYTREVKKYKPIEKINRDRLAPIVSKEAQEKSKVLVRKFALVEEGREGGGLKQTDVFDESVMQSAEFRVELSDIQSENEILYLHEPLEISIRYEAPQFHVEFIELGISIVSDEFYQAKKEFQESFISLYHVLEQKDTDELSLAEQTYSTYFSEVIFASSDDANTSSPD